MSPKPLPTPHSDFDAALAAARAGRFVEAIQQAQRVVAASEREAVATPGALALGSIGRMAARGGDGAAAERAFEDALALRPRFADLLYEYGCVLVTRQRRHDGRRALEKAIAINPRYVAARVELAMLDAREGLIGESLAALRALQQDAPVEDARAFSQGIQRLEHADWDAAEALIRRGLRLENAELAGRLERIEALLREDRPADAAEELRALVPRHEGYPDLHLMLGTAELRLGHVDDALASFGRALELNPDLHTARVRFAHALDAAGMTAAALDQIALVQQFDPQHREAAAFLETHTGRAARAAARR